MKSSITSNSLTKVCGSISSVLTCTNLASHREVREKEVQEAFEGTAADNVPKPIKDARLHAQSSANPQHIKNRDRCTLGALTSNSWKPKIKRTLKTTQGKMNLSWLFIGRAETRRQWSTCPCLAKRTSIQRPRSRASLLVQLLRLHAPHAGGTGSIPDQGTRPPQLTACCQLRAHMLWLSLCHN